MKRILLTLGSLALALASAQLDAAPLGTTFTYQGRLTDGANPANGTISMVFGLWDADMAGSNVGSPSSISTDVSVANGLFTVDLDFGAAAFSGDARWLAIRVNGTLMTTRQRVAPTPNALYASMAGTANAVAANGVSGISLQTGSLHFNGPTYLHENTLYFGTDASHGVGWRRTYAGANIDGPVLFGYGGGALGSTVPDVLALSWNRQGNVGIGSDLSINGSTTMAGACYAQGNVEVGNSAFSASGLNEFTVQGIFDVGSGVTRTRLVVKQNGNVGIGRATPQAKLDVNGDARVSVLTITGGSDVAEPFQMSTREIPKGAVVVIDEENAGKLKLSTRAYDNRVAGIVSGANGINPGIALHQDGVFEGGQNVALSGRVYVQADASSGPITPGDLLTTSNSPGHAMKVTDHAKAQGAIIGKAMSALNEGKGMVLVLVTLQ
jgi:hypothetical protein